MTLFVIQERVKYIWQIIYKKNEFCLLIFTKLLLTAAELTLWLLSLAAWE